MEEQTQQPITPQEIPQTPKKGSLLKWILLILGALFILILVSGAYFLGKNTQTNPSPVSLTPTVTQTPPLSPVPTLNSTKTPSQAMLEVSQFGVKIPLTEDISDAYVVQPAKSDNFVYLKVHSLDNEPQCKKDESSTAAISKVGKDEINVMADKKYSESYKGVTIGNYFYFIDLAQYSCAESTEGKIKLDKVREAFKNASSLIQAL